MTNSTINLSASLEDYLEAIFRIVQNKPAARAKDISKRLGVGRSSVTGALHALADRKLINYAPYDVITLTDAGRAAAENVTRRHEVLRTFLVKVLAVNPEEAESAACKMEHAISQPILERLAEFVEFVDHCPCKDKSWSNSFANYCQNNVASSENDNNNNDTPKDNAKMEVDMTLATMKPRDKASIVKITGSGNLRRRLLDMGVIANTPVEVERVAPLGDPIEVKIKGYHLSLRKEEAERILVKNLS